MKIYDWHIAPNPRRLHMYVAEKGLDIPLVEVGTDKLTLSDEYKAKYPHAMVPMLELDDGTCIGDNDVGFPAGVPHAVADRLVRRIKVGDGDDLDDLNDEIFVTVIHEIAHAAGIDDDRLHELGWA